MAQRANGPLRWRDEERRLVEQYLNDGRLDATRVGNAAYLRTIQQREPIWARHPAKNFYQNVRRQTAIWLAAQPRAGGRRAAGGGAAAAGGQGDDNDSDDEDDEDDDFLPPAEDDDLAPRKYS